MKQDGQSVRALSDDNRSLIIMTNMTNTNSYVFPDVNSESHSLENSFLDRRSTLHAPLFTGLRSWFIMSLSESSADRMLFVERCRDLAFRGSVYFGLPRGSPDSKSTAATPSMNPVITAMVDAGVILLVNVGAR
jgi:hypothetical protein